MLILIILTLSYQLVRRRQRSHHWSIKKARVVFGLFNFMGLFFGLLIIEMFIYASPRLELHLTLSYALIALIYGLIISSLTFIKYSNNPEEKKRTIFDEDFVPQRDILILREGKERLKLESIAIIIIILPLLAAFVALYFLL
ncbi:hypothetical protein ACFOZ3_10930 [Litchfieldia salsa]